MKSEHRHELQTSELEKLAAKGQSFFEQHGNTILIILCMIMLISAGVVYWIRSAQVVATHGWGQLIEATTPGELETVGSRWPESPAGQYAQLREAESLLDSGIQQSFSHREASDSDLKKAKEIFSKLMQSQSIPQQIDERAKFGLACVLEAQSGADVTEAIKAYEGLINKYPDTIYKAICDMRIARLKAGDSHQFYAWFQQQTPSPEDRDTVQDTPFEPPAFSDELKEPLVAPKPDPLESPNFPPQGQPESKPPKPDVSETSSPDKSEDPVKPKEAETLAEKSSQK